jgi:hypothetical protein
MQKCAARPPGLYTIELIDIVPQKTVSMAMKTQQKNELMTFPMNDMMPPAKGKATRHRPVSGLCPDPDRSKKREHRRPAGDMSMTI